MNHFTAELDWLPPGQRDEVARHLQQSYDMNYGSLERQEQLVFRVGINETQRTEPPAVFLRTLTEQVRAGGPVQVKVPRGKPDQYRISELLAQSARRAADQVTGQYGGPASAALATMLRAWDSQRKLSGDEFERAEWLQVPGAPASAAEVRSGVIG